MSAPKKPSSAERLRNLRALRAEHRYWSKLTPGAEWPESRVRFMRALSAVRDLPLVDVAPAAGMHERQVQTIWAISPAWWEEECFAT